MFDLKETQLKGNLEQKYLLVEISGSFYAFSISIVKEVLPMIEVFSTAADKNIVGIIKLRDENIPVFDFRRYNGETISKLEKQQNLVILQFTSCKVAVIADNLLDIISVEDERISTAFVKESILNNVIIDEKRILFVNSIEFHKYIITILNYKCTSEEELVPIEQKSLSLIKTRTEILNNKDSYIFAEDTFLNEKFIVFRLQEEIYAFNILYVDEIKKITEENVSTIPCVPDFIRGIINADGDYISVIDIKSFLNMQIMPLQNKLDIVIIVVNGMKIALLVDEIIDIEQLSPKQMVLTSPQEISFIKGEISKEKYLINMLDVEKLFSSQNINIENYDIE